MGKIDGNLERNSEMLMENRNPSSKSGFPAGFPPLANNSTRPLCRCVCHRPLRQ